jgi:hypothetical protein
MKTFKVKVGDKNFEVSLPTSISEISVEYLNEVTEHIKVGPEYSLVAIIYKEKLPILLNNTKNNQQINASVVPLFVRSGDTESTFVKGISAKDILIVTGSDLSLGIHVTSPINNLSINGLANMFLLDKEFVKSIWTDTTYYMFIEFKLIPNCNIHGVNGKIKEEVEYSFIKEIKD